MIVAILIAGLCAVCVWVGWKLRGERDRRRENALNADVGTTGKGTMV